MSEENKFEFNGKIYNTWDFNGKKFLRCDCNKAMPTDYLEKHLPKCDKTTPQPQEKLDKPVFEKGEPVPKGAEAVALMSKCFQNAKEIIAKHFPEECKDGYYPIQPVTDTGVALFKASYWSDKMTK